MTLLEVKLDQAVQTTETFLRLDSFTIGPITSESDKPYLVAEFSNVTVCDKIETKVPKQIVVDLSTVADAKLSDAIATISAFAKTAYDSATAAPPPTP